MPIGPVGLSYPKHRSEQTIIIPIARTDNATVKAVLPKDAVVSGVQVYQATDAVTDVGSFTVGLGSDADGLLEAFEMATTAVGLVDPGVDIGVGFLTKLTVDTTVTSTYTVGSSTAGGTGYVIISFFLAGPGEAVDD